MNNNHLPAGQPMPGGVGGGPGPGPGPGSNGGRRRPNPQYPSHQQYHHQQHVTPPIYHNSYMNPYANSYYPQAHPYQNGGMPSQPYGMPYNPYSHPPQRSPPPTIHQQYPPIVSSSMQPHPQPYPRAPPQQQPSPAISTPPPFVPAAAPAPPMPVPQTPSSTHSSHALSGPLTPPTPQNQIIVPTPPEVETVPVREPFRAPLPWLSRPELPFPSKATKSRRRRRALNADAVSVELPPNQQMGTEMQEKSMKEESTAPETPTIKAVASSDQADSTAGLQVTSEASSTQETPSEKAQQNSPSTTPGSAQTAQLSTPPNITPTKPAKSASRPAVPAVPVVPILPKSSPKDTKTVQNVDTKPPTENSPSVQDEPAKPAENLEPLPAPVPAKVTPKLWTGLFARPTPSVVAPAGNSDVTSSGASGSVSSGVADVGSSATKNGSTAGTFAKSNASSLAEVLKSYKVSAGQKIAFLEPRGLINTGNMCYMNSVLQVLIFCLPFYDFLDQVSKRAAYSFKSETPLIDAMIMFMREYKVIDSAVSVDQLRRRLKSEELEQYGEPFTPEFVYDAIRKLPRFDSMRRGHQQDAEEFLGFLLELMHDECAHVMRRAPDSSNTAPDSSTATSTTVSSPTSTVEHNDWLEVGRRQRTAVTRSSGHSDTSSPLTKIFGGQLRSEFRVQGLQDSVTVEPFQPLQLDIGASHVHNIIDALKGLTKPETLHGDFKSPRGRDAVATKQVLIESLPAVLILHLKRFQFDAEGTGTVKIWKKVGYPLELELPQEVFTRQKRNSLLAAAQGFPKYKLIAAVYHHGKNASGGHYTVDLRRQDGREWIRIDDTIIRRVRSEDVAEGGAEEEKKPTTFPDSKKDGVVESGNRFDGIGDEAGDDEGWSKVSNSVNGTKKWSSVVNGAANSTTPTKGKMVKDNIKDNKVAYLLFYQRI
ncbi:cysteine proteinase [Xylariomycetidae sp. FL2044]|nr:cysteine proteinase [Xylariomycetidae sp. FL2044]